MCKHEEKQCPRCKAAFECKPGNITQCQCNAIQLSAEERIYIDTKFEDCLCIHCLGFLQKEYAVFKEVQLYKQV